MQLKSIVTPYLTYVLNKYDEGLSCFLLEL